MMMMMMPKVSEDGGASIVISCPVSYAATGPLRRMQWMQTLPLHFLFPVITTNANTSVN